MKVQLYLGDKKVSQKYMKEILGIDRYYRMLSEAKQAHMEDPLEEQSYFLGKLGVMRIEFS